MFLWNNDADVLAPDGSQASGFLDSPKSVETVQFLSDLVLKHKASPDLSQAAAAGADLFATGQAAMKVVGHWYLITLKASKDVDMRDIAVVELPTNLEKSVTVMYEAGNAIGAKCRHPELAWEFLKYFSSFSVQNQYNSSGIAVSARNDVEAGKVAKYKLASRALSPEERSDLLLNESFQNIVPSARPPWGATVEGYDRVETIGQKALDAILKNGVAVQTALTQAAQEIDLEFSRR
jgi:multiple sugar transport system substrate-binding protein